MFLAISLSLQHEEASANGTLPPVVLTPGAEPVEIDLSHHFDCGEPDRIRFRTALGDFDIDLFRDQTPLTVANFLSYVFSGAYDNSFIHRSVPGFIVQGGGFAFHDFEKPYPEATDYVRIPTGPPVVNEPGISNLRGTIAMAKLGGDPDSATNQWFFNLADNSANLDAQNGGFTVFGEVIGGGMSVVDAISQVPIWNAEVIDPAFQSLPLIDYVSPGPFPDENNLVMVWSVQPHVTLSASTDRPDLFHLELNGAWLTVRVAARLEKAVETAAVTVRAEAMDGQVSTRVFQAILSEKGDFTGDGIIDMADVILLLRTMVGEEAVSETHPGYVPSSGDTSGDGRMGMEDAVFLIRLLAGYAHAGL